MTVQLRTIENNFCLLEPVAIIINKFVALPRVRNLRQSLSIHRPQHPGMSVHVNCCPLFCQIRIINKTCRFCWNYDGENICCCFRLCVAEMLAKYSSRKQKPLLNAKPKAFSTEIRSVCLSVCSILSEPLSRVLTLSQAIRLRRELPSISNYWWNWLIVMAQ